MIHSKTFPLLKIFVSLVLSVLLSLPPNFVLATHFQEPNFGNGNDGDLLVLPAQTVHTDEIRTSLSATAAASQRVVPVVTSTGFATGQEVLIIQMQGTGAGSYEFGKIDIVESTSLTLVSNLSNTYTIDSNSRAQVVRVPHYNNVTVQGLLTAHPWDGNTGGIIAFRALGSVNVESGGRISASGLGYRGGSFPGISVISQQGEGTPGLGSQSTAANNGGGGGGIREEDTTNAKNASGGGGGGYGTLGTAGGGIGTDNPQRPPQPGGSGGETYGVPDLSLLYFGGGGGEGGGKQGSGGGGIQGEDGGNGGGIILLIAHSLSASGTINADGTNGVDMQGASVPGTNDAFLYGGGGGGAGGSILIRSASVDVGVGLVTATGGSGSPQNLYGGAGGNGGSGRIRIEYCDVISGSSNPTASMQQLVCTPSNQPPLADSGGPYTVPEGESVTLSGSGSDPDGDPLTYSWDLDNNGTFETVGQSVTFSATSQDGPSTQTVALQICDNKGACATSSTTVNITNVTPTVGAITVPVDPVQVNTSINASANFTDPGIPDTHEAVWNWGDGTTSAGTVTETNGSGSVTGNHTYTAAGFYDVNVTVTDDDGGSSQGVPQRVVIYDPSAGFVTGGGQIDSPTGAYPANPSLTGRANFGFVVKYQKGATTPMGKTQFRFPAADLNFQSTSYQWLVVSGARAQFKGSGIINGGGDYSFILTVIDGQVSGGGVDKFRIKITDNTTNTVAYDNQLGASDTDDPTALVVGSIVIHP